MMLRDKVEDALRGVYDPELPVNIYDLGLVYKVKTDQNNNVFIEMTLTAPACAASDGIILDVKTRLKAIEDVGNVQVDLVFDPPWNREMMSDEARVELGWL